MPDRLQAFIAELQPLGVFAEVKRNLSLKWRSADGRDFHLGSVYLNGELGTDYAQWSVYAIQRADLGTRHQQTRPWPSDPRRVD